MDVADEARFVQTSLGRFKPHPNWVHISLKDRFEMARVTLSILEGVERGRVFRNLQTPITIGREEVNDVQLNDERVSRLHAKLQEDQGSIIFTDLNSTNGSRVNGHPVQLRVLRAGDHLQVGRCTLLFGSEEEIATRAKQLGVTVQALMPLSAPPNRSIPAGGADDAEFCVADNVNSDHLLTPLFHGEKPPLPSALNAGQRARLSDVLTYAHEQLQNIVLDARQSDQEGSNAMEVAWEKFQNILLLERDLAQWLQQAANPDLEL